jgi:DNA-binding SARP family transcriptional activator
MRFALLGPLVFVRDAGKQVAVGGARLRALLAALLLRANEPVPLDALADAVWDGAPPPGAPTTLRGHVLRLRRTLEPDAGTRITVRDPGYLIEVASSEFDVLEFQALSHSCGVAIRSRNWPDAARTATAALALWRGTPLVDVRSEGLRDAWIPRLEHERVQVLEWLIEANLHLQRHDQLVPELRTLVGEHPLRERFHAQLMLALAGTGRRAEALAAYHDARQVLVDQLGIEPGPELRDLQELILAGEL